MIQVTFFLLIYFVFQSTFNNSLEDEKKMNLPHLSLTIFFVKNLAKYILEKILVSKVLVTSSLLMSGTNLSKVVATKLIKVIFVNLELYFSIIFCLLGFSFCAI